MKNFLFLLGLFVVQASIFANNSVSFEEVWKALEAQDKVTARKLLEKKSEKPESRTAATMALMLLNHAESRDDENLDMMKKLYPDMDSPSEFLFSMWNDRGIMNNYSKKEKERVDFIYEIIADKRVNGSIRASARYLLGLHYLWSNQKSKSDRLWEKIGALKNWEFTGPFENATGSGFDKNYPPIESPESDSKFLSKNNSNIYWFQPKSFQNEPYIATEYYFHDTEAVVYAQTFVHNPKTQKVIFGTGATGNLKVWVNDVLIISQEEELRTDMDLHTYETELPKGVNRILVQLGHTKKSGYPNFALRLLDENFEPLEGFTSTHEFQPYNKSGTIQSVNHVPHFAEDFFEKKVKADPKNILWHLLLSKTYYRSNKFNEAISVLEEAKKLYPNNVLVQYELIQSYSAVNDRTNLVKNIDTYRNLDDNSLFLMYYDYDREIRNKNYAKAEEYLNQIRNRLGETDADYYLDAVKFWGYKKEYVKMVDLIEVAYAKYPNHSTFVEYKFLIDKNGSPEGSIPTDILEKYLETNFNGKISSKLIEEYIALGEKRKAEDLMVSRLEIFPETVEYLTEAIRYFYKAKNFKKSLELVEFGLANMPFNHSRWHDKAYIHEALGEKKAAISALKKAIHYNPNLFSARERLRELEGKKPLSEYFDKPDSYELINTSLTDENNSDESYEYIFNETNIAVFREGPYVEHSYVALKILNNAGLEHWKEASVSYNSDVQNLIISKAEVIKKSGQKIEAEQSGNQLVFPNLEIGDAILIKYQLETFAVGKLRKEFWIEKVLNDYVPMQSATFRFFVPHDYRFELKTQNLEIQPDISKADDFTIYEWNLENPEKIENEFYMPSSTEVGKTIHISTVKSWKTIAEWYRDLALTQAKEDYNLNRVYSEIFDEKKAESDYEKAKLIYEYLTENVRYSSLPFRQNGYIPQKPMKTISTQLGDCKDLSTLYHTLAKKAGLQTHLVLVSSKSNGENNLLLPTVSFDHCIVKIDLGEESLFQELTDSKLPFGYVPETVRNAQGLIIPNDEKDSEGGDLILIPEWKDAKSRLLRKTSVKVTDDVLDIETNITALGPLASEYRWYFSGLTKKE